MAFVAGNQSRIVFDDFALSAVTQDIDVSQDLDLADVSILTDTGHKWLPTLDTGTVAINGVWDNSATAGDMDETVDTSLASASGQLVTVGWDGLAVGKRVAAMTVRSSTYSTSGNPTDAVKFALSLNSDGLTERGVSLHDLEAETATANETSVDNSASSSNGCAGYLHVTAASGTSPTLDVKVQHSADNSTWADLLTFAQATARTTELVTATGTVNRYVRAIWTITGTGPSFTFAIGFARR